MPSSDNKSINYARIMHRLLINPRGWNLNDMCKEFGITKRTWRNYKNELEHLPELLDRQGESMLEYAGSGSNRVIRLRADMPSSGSSHSGFRSRLVAMHFARKMFTHLKDTPVGEEIELLLNRFEETFRDVHVVRRALKGADRKLHVIDGASKDYSQHGEVIAKLVDATLRERVIRGEYKASWSRDGEHRISELEPLSLVSSSGALYLLARTRKYIGLEEDNNASGKPHDKEVILTFAVDRFLSVEVLDESFEYPSSEAFDPEDFFEGEFGLYQRHDSEPIRVEVVFSKVAWLQQYLQERTWHKTQRFEDLDDGRLKMTFTVGDMGSVWPWIRSFGSDIEVLKPEGPIPMNSHEQREWRHRSRSNTFY